MKAPLLVSIRLYRTLLSPLLSSSCRFYPTCSVYSEEAISRYGARKGVLLAVRRLGRCHPWCRGGYDPVP